ncbi:hypothetical protein M6B38_255965 [Iris pallida]|uniref:Uncharacterized protein n=1 Tax=Iris pallida TaxID=29817 RepID=A0AAX6IH09_IRIPA|nr:hypothetical protein M6B38_255965 [Iris pallida]
MEDSCDRFSMLTSSRRMCVTLTTTVTNDSSAVFRRWDNDSSSCSDHSTSRSVSLDRHLS